MVPLVSKLYCSSTEVVYVVRKRPHVINGGGFVVTNCDQKVVFSVDGCGILGKAEELILRDERRDALLLIRGKVISKCSTCFLNKSFLLFLHKNGRFGIIQHSFMFQGGIFEALSFNKIWNAYRYDFQGSKKLVFSLRKPKSCLPVDKDTGIRITTKPNLGKKDWDFEISGYFPGKECSIIDSQGNLVAQVRLNLS